MKNQLLKIQNQVAILMLLSFFDIHAQTIIQGRICDTDDGTALVGAIVFIANTTHAAGI
ncbi:hypothetical protein [Marinigracilibium pacificum]|uniref:Uncharacterized protein n=1 Tax=Marinigracilibium pacificum TaxID=2729599 RepID=A0A848J650_9BACT|nr:hypothetical protein [Marinigracilibium pacificum]NMM49944.1 hypothetical protein [Marinigracilibium pacificum]